MRVKELFAFIRERHSIYERRTAGQLKPWTDDPILRAYRFCNVYRELDKVTVWIRKNWREPNAADPDLWFAMVTARLLNKPESLEAIGYPVPWNIERFRCILRARKLAGEKIFSAAYMIHAANSSALKTDYLAGKVLSPMWRARETLRPRTTDTLATFHTRLMTQRDMGSFMAAQVVADTKFTPPLEKALDWWTWAAPGPGSKRGLNRVFDFEPDKPWSEIIWLHHLALLGLAVNKEIRAWEMPRLSAQDLQNCLCEFDKYERVRLGEGRPKQLYPGI